MNISKSAEDLNQELDIARLIRVLLMQSKMIISIILAGTFIGIYLYTSAIKEYRVSSMLQVYTNSSSPLNSRNASDFLFGSSSSSASDVNLLVNLYQTRSNILSVINRFHLNVLVQNEKKLKLDINDIKYKFNQEDDYLKFYIKFLSDGYQLLDSEEQFLNEGNYNNLVSTENVSINLSKPSYIPKKNVKIVIREPSSMFLTIQNKFSLNTIESGGFGSTDGLIKISYITDDVEQGIKIIDFANDIFLESSIEFETEKARKAIDFIDEQLISVTNILDQKKQNLKEFKEDNQSLNVDLEIESIIDTISKIEENINLIDIELAEASSKFTATNPVFLSLNDRKSILENQKVSVEERIRNLPIAEQKYIDLYRDVEISQELFLDLSNRKLGFSIMEASTLGNIRIVDDAYLDMQVSPSLMLIIFAGFISIIISLLAAVIRATLFLPITNPAELNDSGIETKIYGVIPVQDKGNDTEITNFERSIESMILNLKSINGFNESKKTILITSPTENNGKSFVSRSLSKKLATMGYKTLLIDNDLIRGDQHKELNQSKITSEQFYNIDQTNIENLKISNNFYFIPKIRQIVDTFNFIHNDKYIDHLSLLKDMFDFIIIDTAPALSISETSILMTYADINMLVVRHNISRISQVKQTIFMAEQIGADFDGVIFNGYSKSKSYYGYYGIYGDYRYQYYADRYLYNYKYDKHD